MHRSYLCGLKRQTDDTNALKAKRNNDQAYQGGARRLCSGHGRSQPAAGMGRAGQWGQATVHKRPGIQFCSFGATTWVRARHGLGSALWRQATTQPQRAAPCRLQPLTYRAVELGPALNSHCLVKYVMNWKDSLLGKRRDPGSKESKTSQVQSTRCARCCGKHCARAGSRCARSASALPSLSPRYAAAMRSRYSGGSVPGTAVHPLQLGLTRRADGRGPGHRGEHHV